MPHVIEGLALPREKQITILIELLSAVMNGEAVMTGALFADRKITLWAEINALSVDRKIMAEIKDA